MAPNTSVTLARRHLASCGMLRTPVCPWRLLLRSGLRVVCVDGPTQICNSTSVVLLDRGLSCRREQGAVLACGVARALLTVAGGPLDEAYVERTGRELLLPGPLVAEDLESLGGDLERLTRQFPDVPHAWIADLADELECGRLRPPVHAFGARVRMQRTGSMH